MIGKSAKIYLSGFLVGGVACYLLILIYPALYLAFIDWLRIKIEIQAALGRKVYLTFPMVIILNNVSASFLCSYGGYFLTKIYMLLGTGSSSTLLRRLSFFDKRVDGIPEDRLKYYLSLYAFPVFILFLNGVVLGAFLLLFLVYYSQDVPGYIRALLPHGLFEIPGIIISGAIGLEIAELSAFKKGSGFRASLDEVAREKLLKYLLVIFLLTVGGVVEGSRV